MNAHPRNFPRRPAFDLELLDRTLRAASDALIAEIHANRAAGRISPVAQVKSDVQFDWDGEREFGWSVA